MHQNKFAKNKHGEATCLKTNLQKTSVVAISCSNNIVEDVMVASSSALRTTRCSATSRSSCVTAATSFGLASDVDTDGRMHGAGDSHSSDDNDEDDVMETTEFLLGNPLTHGVGSI